MKFQKSFYNVEIKNEDGLLIYNILTQGFVMLDDREYENFYKNSELWEKDNEKLSNFIKHGFIVEKDDRIEYLKKFNIYKNYEENLSITFVPTQNCNFGCSYCFEKNEEKLTMSEETLKGAIDFTQKLIEERDKLKSVDVCFFGGEPLLEIDKILRYGKKIKETCENKGINYTSSLITNGYYLNFEVAQKLFNEINLSFVQITFDGNRVYHNKTRITKDGEATYEIIFNNLKEIIYKWDKKIPFKTSIRIQVNKENLKSLKDLLIDLKEFDLSENLNIYFSPILGEWEENKNYIFNYFDEKEFGKVYVNEIIPLIFELKFKNFALYPQPVVNPCGIASANSYIIDCDGTLKECWELIGGNENFGTVFNHNEEKRKLSKIELPAECENCKYLPLCTGGCPLRRLRGKKKCTFWKYCIKEYMLTIYKFLKNGGV